MPAVINNRDFSSKSLITSPKGVFEELSTVYRLFTGGYMPSYHNFSQIEEIERFMEGKVIEFGKKVRELRRSRKMTQEELAEFACINSKYLGEIERGEKKPTAFVLYKIVNALQVPICEILSTNSCPHANGAAAKKIASLLSGREEEDLTKALKILEILLE